ncbi:MAG: hypothetical protein IRZ33_10665 [Alicyclobacillaceae bacterium]|nr:hypothetical protein [Alicyclobacillaceae bacterium]
MATKEKPYQRPVCHCGHELLLFEEYVNEICKVITERGKVGHTLKRGFYINEPRRTLRCLKCRNYYDVKFDDIGRILRGRKHSARRVHTWTGAAR